MPRPCPSPLFAALALALACTGNMVGERPDPSRDAGPAPTGDAGSPSTDAGSPTEDAGSPTPTADAGSPTEDAGSPTEDAGSPMPSDPLTFAEVDGLVAVEAEHYVRIENEEDREWVRFDAMDAPSIEPDPDPPPLEGAAGGAYLENLPDTRATMDDPIEHGVSFHPNGGTGPMLTYRVRFETPGTYVVWVRAYSTGTEDNGIHAGIDGTFPGSGERVQWCAGKHQWTWSSAQRTTSNHCGTPGTITLDVDSAGVHEIHFSLREDGFEFDKFVLALDAGFEPSGEGPAEVLAD